MKRSELKQLLKEMGVYPKLVEMPAVIEPLYKQVMDKTISQVKDSGRIIVEPNGEFSDDYCEDVLGKKTERKVTFSEDGKVEISTPGFKTTVNEYGIETGIFDQDWMTSHPLNYERTKYGFIDARGQYLDNGHWSLKQARGLRTAQLELTDSEKEKIISEFDEVVSQIIEEYPNTAEWYSDLKIKLSRNIGLEDSKIEELNDKKTRMNRKELKQLLKEMGVREELIEMPAVVEPIFLDYEKKGIDALKTSGEIVVSENGDFKFGDSEISLQKNGTAKISLFNFETYTNEYGIEVLEEAGKGTDIQEYFSRENGKVYKERANDLVASFHLTASLDTGHWSISRAREKGVLIEESDGKKAIEGFAAKIEDVNLEEVLSSFDKNASSTIENYPKTEVWYAKTRAAIIENVYKAKNEKLERQNRDLLDSSEKVTQMLGRTLKFVEKVKSSPVGQIFFRKGLKEVDADMKKLNPGKKDSVKERDE